MLAVLLNSTFEPHAISLHSLPPSLSFFSCSLFLKRLVTSWSFFSKPLKSWTSDSALSERKSFSAFHSTDYYTLFQSTSADLDYWLLRLLISIPFITLWKMNPTHLALQITRRELASPAAVVLMKPPGLSFCSPGPDSRATGFPKVLLAMWGEAFSEKPHLSQMVPEI